jgi:hypothetical protein
MKINSTLHRFGYRRRRQPARPPHSHLIPVFHVVSLASHYFCSCLRSYVPSLDPSSDPPHVDRRAHLMIISCPIIAIDHRPVVGKNAFDCLNGGCECTGKHLRSVGSDVWWAGKMCKKMASCSHRSKPAAAAGGTERSASQNTMIRVGTSASAHVGDAARPSWAGLCRRAMRTGRRAVCIRKAQHMVTAPVLIPGAWVRAPCLPPTPCQGPPPPTHERWVAAASECSRPQWRPRGVKSTSETGFGGHCRRQGTQHSAWVEYCSGFVQTSGRCRSSDRRRSDTCSRHQHGSGGRFSCVSRRSSAF